jgi:hypothetical protein
MKASLSIDRLVDLSLNYRYTIVTKKGYWCIPSSVEDLNKFLHQRIQSVLGSISRLIRGQTDRIWAYQLRIYRFCRCLALTSPTRKRGSEQPFLVTILHW